MYSANRKRIAVDTFNFDNIDPHLAAFVTDSFLDAGTKIFDAAALTSDEDSWACCFEFNFQLIGFAGDQHVADAGRAVFLVDELANPIVFLKKCRICLAGGVPA
jgi:hypothetical protein